jgi:hypothetical protein
LYLYPNFWDRGHRVFKESQDLKVKLVHKENQAQKDQKAHRDHKVFRVYKE